MSFPTVILLTLLALYTPSIADQASFRPKALVLPITKDVSTKQYVTVIHQRTPLVPITTSFDLGGPFLWVDCDHKFASSSWKPVRCGSAQCNLAGSKSCTTECFSAQRPGCTNNTCGLIIDNRFIGVATSGDLGQDVLTMQSTDRINPGRNASVPNFLLGCGSAPVLPGLPKGAVGIAGFGRSKVSVPYQLSSAFSFSKKFAICLSSGTGVVFFGGGPYHFLPNKVIDVQKYTTPLILNPVSTAGAYIGSEKSTDYFIKVTSILIGGKPVRLNSSLLTIDKDGNGGTMISTVVPYTVMATSIYKAVAKAFSSQISYAPVVRAVAPFKLCYNSSYLSPTRVGWNVPAIELVLHQKDVRWTMFGSTSMVMVADDVACLGLVDGGAEARTAIVIGGYQVEDSLLEFDLAASTLGFFNTLPFIQTTCANFNFTTHL